jgi:sec-independent protein translocase protein TatA
MGLDNPLHIAFLLIVILLVFGAKRLPEVGRSLGSGLRGFKESLSGQDLQQALSSPPQQPAIAPAPPDAATQAVAQSAPAAAAPQMAGAPPAEVTPLHHVGEPLPPAA